MKKVWNLFNFLLASFLFFLVFFWESAPQTEIFNKNWFISTVDGKFFLKKENEEKLLVLYFGYTFCPDVCPSTLLEIAQSLEDLPPKVLNQMEILLVSLDPERDTPPYLAQYARFFHPKIKAGLAFPLKKLTQNLGVVYQKRKEPPFLIDHSAQTFLIAPQEKTIQRLAFGATKEEFRSAILSLTHSF